MKRLSLGAEGVFKCNECAGELLLTPEMNVRFQTSDGQQFLSIDECYRSIRIEERDINNPQTPPLPVSFINPSERVIAAANGCELSKESGVRFTSLLSGEATLTNAALYVTTREERVRIALDLITSATIESNNKLQLYLQSTPILYQLVFHDDSALRWQDLICCAISTILNKNINRT